MSSMELKRHSSYAHSSDGEKEREGGGWMNWHNNQITSSIHHENWWDICEIGPSGHLHIARLTDDADNTKLIGNISMWIAWEQ